MPETGQNDIIGPDPGKFFQDCLIFFQTLRLFSRQDGRTGIPGPLKDIETVAEILLEPRHQMGGMGISPDRNRRF